MQLGRNPIKRGTYDYTGEEVYRLIQFSSTIEARTPELVTGVYKYQSE